MSNPLLNEFKTPYNSIPFNLIKPEHLVPAFKVVVEETKQVIDSLIHNPEKPDFKNTIVALENSSSKINRLSEVLFNLNIAETGSELQKIAQEVSPILTEFRNDIILNKELFIRVKEVYQTIDTSTLDTEDNRLLKKTYDDFVRNGANLLDSDKQEYRKVTNELSKLSLKFDENVLAETNSFFLHLTEKTDLQGLPEDLIHAAEEEAKLRKLVGWVFTLHFPSMVPFMQYADNRELRKKLFIAHNTRAYKNNKNNNTEIIRRITELRLKKANILGFDTYADFILSNRMAEKTEKVLTFLDKLLKASLPAAKNEVKEVQDYAKSIGTDFELQSWDWLYYSEKLKEAKYDINNEMTRPYFQLEKVQESVMELANTLYGLNFRVNKEIPVYNSDVKVYEVFDENEKFLSLLYLDYFPRKSKKGGAWMTQYLEQSKSDEGVDTRPHVSLVFNFSKPTSKKPSLLTFNEVTTLLHEFGHALHGILSDCKYSEISGTSVYRDFVELPSQMLENWAEQTEWLNKVAEHWETKEKIPSELVDKIINSRNYHAGYQSIRQISFGITDMKWHTISEPYLGDIEEFENNAMAPTRLLPKIEGVMMSTSFSHIFSGGYSAGYYSYKWAEVLDADAFELFKEKGIFNTQVAASFRENILSKGGSEHPMDLYVKFRGHEPEITPLLKRSGLLK